MTPPEDPVGPVPPADELDELASALLDGATSADEQARADEPAIRAQVEARRLAFEQVRAAIAAPVAVDAEAREQAIAAALAAADLGDAGAGDDVDGDGDELTTRRTTSSRPASRRMAPLRLVGAAAAVIAAVALGASILGGGDGSDDTATEGADDAVAGGIEASESPAVDDGSAPLEAPDSLEVARLGDLGEFESVAALSDAVVTARSNGFGEASTESEDDGDADLAAPDRCDVDDSTADLELRSLVATATIDGAPVEVWAVAGDDLVVIDDACDVVALPSPLSPTTDRPGRPL